jgi:hypothetical protein
MTHPGSDVQPGQQPEGAWVPPQSGATAAEPEKKSGAKKWLSVAGTVVVLGGVAAAKFIGFGGGDPEAGDCLHEASDSQYDVVDCGSDDADYKVLGVDGDEMTQPDLDKAIEADTVCADFPTWEYALWYGDMETEPGTVYCTKAV